MKKCLDFNALSILLILLLKHPYSEIFHFSQSYLLGIEENIIVYFDIKIKDTSLMFPFNLLYGNKIHFLIIFLAVTL